MEGSKSGTQIELSELPESTPRLKLLVTSRERLKLSGEWVQPNGSLDCPQAVRGWLLLRICQLIGR